MSLYRGLLISSRRNFERSASSEMYFTLTKKLLLDPNLIKVKRTGISGLSTASIDKSIDLDDVMEKLRQLELEDNYFIHISKIKPIKFVIDSDLKELKENLFNFIPQTFQGSFKIEISKRHTPLRSAEIIDEIAPLIHNPVNLDNPDNVILIEILSNKMGISFIQPQYILTTRAAYNLHKNEDENWFLD